VGESKLVAGRYRTLRELGRGGMGIVWLAEDQVIGRKVALKELRTSSQLELERVLREARTAGRLNSPNVVAVYDVVGEFGLTYLVMELVEAPTLADVMARRGALPAEHVIALGLQVLNALEAAHAAGIVHRDVKPSNIMVLPDGGAKLADFGIARALDDPSLTATGGIMGSPGYMAPELFAGSPPSPASDLWGLGATLFHAVEGRAPFLRDTTAATMHAVMYEPPVLHKGKGLLGSVIMGLLTRSAETRLTAQQVREVLALPPVDTVVFEPVTTVVTKAVTTTPWAEDDEPKAKPRKVAAIAAAAAAVVALALAAVFLLKPTTQHGEASPAPNGGAQQLSSSATSSTAGSSALPSSTAASSSAASTTPSASAKQTEQPPAVSATTTKPAKPTHDALPLSRYRDGGGWHYSGTSRLAVPQGFAIEATGGLGKLLGNAEPGTKPLYSCDLNGTDDRMSSLSSTCEGHGVYGLLGHVFAAKPDDVATLPLFRCNMGAHHFDSVTTDCEGKSVEFQFGWVLP
jgi:serine/threonine protein kinase